LHLAAGVFFYFFWQILINMGMVLGLMPVVGIPLPFLSYGGTATLVNFILDGLVLNAGGLGGKQPGAHTSDGATTLFATNVLGHALLVDELVAAGKLGQVVIYAGAEAARGIPMLKMKRPELAGRSVDELAAVIDGSFFDEPLDPMVAFPYVKAMAALWMASAARQYPQLRVVTISPGGSAGSAMKDVPPVLRFMLRTVVQPLFKVFGKFHDLETGASRYVDGLNDDAYESGVFYGAAYPGLTGPLVDQSTIFAELGDRTLQDRTHEAMRRFLP
jgi:NAD(P)-dependent dehydrogenase (short-subunit alcohol dehydrogenase family)